jgi:formylglycine-generating enzyme required for sulfatase activity
MIKMIRLACYLLIGLSTITSLNSCKKAHASNQIPTAQEIGQFLAKQQNQMVFVQGGKFEMGPGNKEPNWLAPNNQPRTPVTLTSYYIDKYNVLWGSYDFYSRVNNLPLLEKFFYDHHTLSRSSNYPVFDITWSQAKAYCAWLAKQTGLAYDLPTEAQWEYAARSRGQEVQWSSNNGLYEPGKNTPNEQQYRDNQFGDFSPTKSALYPPNPLGLYDMTGSVAQWAKNSMYDYPGTPQVDPQGLNDPNNKVVRGGGYTMDTNISGVYYREGVDPTQHNEGIGFRCVINSSLPPEQLKANMKK